MQLLDLAPLGGSPGDLTRATVRLVNELVDQVDVVVVDTPPLAVTTEALEFVPAAKVVVLVGRLGRTATAAAQRAGELARFGGAEQIAVAITDTGRAHLRRSHYYSYYGETGGGRRKRKAARASQTSAVNGEAAGVDAVAGTRTPTRPTSGRRSTSSSSPRRVSRFGRRSASPEPDPNADDG